MKIIKITIVESYGADTISLQTELPCPHMAAYDDSLLSLEFKATKGTGTAYVRKHFGVFKPEIINIREGGITQKWGGETFEIWNGLKSSGM